MRHLQLRLSGKRKGRDEDTSGSSVQEGQPLLSALGDEDARTLARDPAGQTSGRTATFTSPPPSHRGELAASGPDIIQFSTAIFYLDEADGEVEIDVMRLGSFQGRAAVRYYTQDGSAKAGRSYVPEEGELVFKDGESSKSFKIRCEANSLWAPTVEFSVALADPEGCSLGKHLRVCRVKVVNDDCFPSSAFDKKVMATEDVVVRLSGFYLWWEYARLNFAQPGMGWRTVFVIAVDQLWNAYLYFQLWFNMYLVDVVFNTHNPDTEDALLVPGSRLDTAVLMGIAWLVPNVALHVWDLTKVFIGIKGKSHGFLQESLFRKYLNYSERSRAAVVPSDMLNSIVQDCDDLSDSYLCAMSLTQKFVKVIILGHFIHRKNPKALWIMVVMPTIMLFFANLRTSKIKRVSTLVGEREVELMALTNEVCAKYRLVADYARRPEINDMFCEKAAAFRAAKRPEVLVFMNSSYFPSLLGCIFVSIFIVRSSARVLNGDLTLGTFLATIVVFNHVSGAFGEIYSAFVQLTKSFEPLAGLTVLYNRETDLLASKELHRQSRQKTKEQRERIFALARKASGDDSSGGSGGQRFLTDQLEISLNELGHRYEANNGDECPIILQDVAATAAQGQMIAIVGPHGSGRTTVLGLLSNVVFPTSGYVVIPTHLRRVHVTKEVILMKMPVWENLTFGISNAEPEKHGPRVKEVLQRFALQSLQLLMERQLKMSPEEVEEHGDLWQQQHTSTERAKLHLARAFIMNPEVLILQRPLSNFNRSDGDSILLVFREFVDHRGICLPEAEEGDRRPRTLFFSPEDNEQAEQADKFWLLERHPTCRNPSANNVVHTVREVSNFAELPDVWS